MVHGEEIFYTYMTHASYKGLRLARTNTFVGPGQAQSHNDSV